MHWIYLIHEFHNLSWITEINELLHDILIHWDKPVLLIFESTKANTLTPQQDLALNWNLRPTCTYTSMATTIAETSEDDTQAFSNKSQDGYIVLKKQNQR